VLYSILLYMYLFGYEHKYFMSVIFSHISSSHSLIAQVSKSSSGSTNHHGNDKNHFLGSFSRTSNKTLFWLSLIMIHVAAATLLYNSNQHLHFRFLFLWFIILVQPHLGQYLKLLLNMFMIYRYS
jgi:hypothetical protein